MIWCSKNGYNAPPILLVLEEKKSGVRVVSVLWKKLEKERGYKRERKVKERWLWKVWAFEKVEAVIESGSGKGLGRRGRSYPFKVIHTRNQTPNQAPRLPSPWVQGRTKYRPHAPLFFLFYINFCLSFSFLTNTIYIYIFIKHVHITQIHHHLFHHLLVLGKVCHIISKTKLR